jgi:hypothetical protein
MSVEVDVETWGGIVMGPNSSQTWWFTWTWNSGGSVFDSNSWYWMSVVPDSDQSVVQVTEQWLNKDLFGNVIFNATFRNNDPNTSVLFRPKIMQAPSKF